MPTGIEKKILTGLGSLERRKQKNLMTISFKGFYIDYMTKDTA